MFCIFLSLEYNDDFQMFSFSFIRPTIFHD